MFEVEAKVQVPSFVDLRRKLQNLGATRISIHVEKDVFYGHPDRDFRETDEALRLREVDGELELTYKGPNRSAALKSRIEHNVGLVDDPTALLAGLGFKEAARIQKKRETWKLGQLSITLDTLPFGKFVEIEALGDDESAAADRVEAALVLFEMEDEPRILESYLALLERHGTG